jgi:hypothetical protein
VIDRAEDGDGDAVGAARRRPAGGERAGTSPADAPADDGAPAGSHRADAAQATAEQRAAACRSYRDTVDHTYHVVRVEAGQDAQSEAHWAPSRGATAPDETPEQDADKDQKDSQRRGESEERAARDGDPDAEAEREGTDARHSEAGSPEATSGEVPEAQGAHGKGAAARDAWAEAVTELRAEWEQHEQRFPERSRLTPSAQLDGGWLADGDRRLTPEQNANASKACEDIRTEGKEAILPALQRIEAADPDRRLAGLEHMLKGEDRLKEKVADYLRAPGTTVREALDTVPDAVRFTLSYNSERYAEGVLSDVDRLKSEGFELIKLKNLWAEEQYKGINSQWRRPETGLRFEMQFHTPESLEAKELTHSAYERIRNPASAAERSAGEDFQRRVNERLDTPPRTAEIRDFPEKR